MEKINVFEIYSLGEKLPVCWYYSAGFRFYWATLKNQKKVILAHKDNEYYLAVDNQSGKWENIQKSLDKFIIGYALYLVKSKCLTNLKVRAYSKCLKINDEKFYIEDIDTYYTFTLQIKHDYTSFINKILDYIEGN